jgi:hypothetical protein
MIMPKISEKELSYTTNSFSSGLRNTADGIAIELLIIPRGIEFRMESLTEKSKNSIRASSIKSRCWRPFSRSIA